MPQPPMTGRGLLICKILSSGCAVSAGYTLVLLEKHTCMNGAVLLPLITDGRGAFDVLWPHVAGTVRKMRSTQFGISGSKIL